MTPTPELKRLAEEAGSGEWIVGGGGYVVTAAGDPVADFLPTPDDEAPLDAPSLSNALARAYFVSAANPARVLHLIEENERLREALEKVRNTTHHSTGFSDLSARRAAFQVADHALSEAKSHD